MEEADIKLELQSMDDYEFEHLVADLWESDGWDTTVSQASNDDGIDVIADKETPFDRKELIQAKRYSSGTNVGGPAIQQYASLRHQEPGVDSVAVVTTSEFTVSAERLAENLNVKLVDGDDLAKWISDIGSEILANYIDGSAVTSISSGPMVQFSESDLAEKIVDYPANQYPESLHKIEELKILFEHHVREITEFVSIQFNDDSNNNPDYQFNEGFHNCLNLDGERPKKLMTIVDGENLTIESEFEYGKTIMVVTENLHDLNGQERENYNACYDVWIAIRIIYEVYDIEFEEIAKAEDIPNDKFGWDEISISEDESSDQKSNSTQPEQLAECALNDSVTVERLTHVGDENHVENYVHDKPIIEYISEGEQPQYFFFNRKSGVEIGEKQINAGWGSDYRNSVLITDKGTHFFVGRDSGDFHEYLPHDSIKSVEARVGILKNRLNFECTNKIYDFKTTPDANEVEEAAKYINDQL